MTWNPNIPNGTQSPGIFPTGQNINNATIQEVINREHIFNVTPMMNDNTGTHRQVSLTNRTDPGALLAGTNGMLYLNTSGVLCFYNGVTISTFTNTIRASIVMNNAAVALGSVFNATAGVAGGLYTITFTTPLPSANYLWSVAAYENGTGTGNNPLLIKVGTVTANTFQFRIVNQNNTPAQSVATKITFMAFGG